MRSQSWHQQDAPIAVIAGLSEAIRRWQVYNLRPYVPQRCGKVGHGVRGELRQDKNNTSKKPAGKVQDDGEIAMAHADIAEATEVHSLEPRPSAPLMPLSEIALTGIYEISKI